MNARGLNCAIHYPVPIHLQEAYRPLGLKPGSFPVVERISGELLSLPMFPELRPAQVQRVAEGLKAVLAEVDNRFVRDPRLHLLRAGRPNRAGVSVNALVVMGRMILFLW